MRFGLCVIFVASLLLCALPTLAIQTTLFNVTLYNDIEGPVTFFAATVPGVAAVMSTLTPNGPAANVTAIDNATGKILWTADSTFDAYQNIGSEGILSVTSRNAFIFRKSSGIVVIVDARSGNVLWENIEAKSSNQLFAVHDALGYVAVADTAGYLLVIDVKNNFQKICSTELMLQSNSFNSFMYLTMSSQYVVVAANGEIFTVLIRGGLLYSLNASSTMSFMSSRYSIFADTLVFNSQSNITVLNLLTGELSTITSLNTDEYTYQEVLVSPAGGTIFILSMDGNFAREKEIKCASGSLNRSVARESCIRSIQAENRLKGGNNYPFIVTANDIETGKQKWQFFTDSTLSHISLANFNQMKKTPLVASVSSGSTVALSAVTGSLVSDVIGGMDYDENWPPLIVDNVWYYAAMYPQASIVNFLAISDTQL